MYVKLTDQGGTPGNDDPYHSYCLNRKDVRLDLAAFKSIAEKLTPHKPRRVLELFGGSGWHSSVIANVVGPEYHEALDLSSDCVETIKRSVPTVEAFVFNSYAYASALDADSFDWIHADFNQYTLHRALTSETYGGALRGIFRGASRFVTITDSAYYGILRFENNRRGYARALGMDSADWRDYYRAASEHYNKKYGFAISEVVTWSGMASMYLLERGGQGEFQIRNASKPVAMETIGDVE